MMPATRGCLRRVDLQYGTGFFEDGVSGAVALRFHFIFFLGMK